ncbi:hypothetical protein GGTG_04585 [Gaeumannomyces tritici R3-111a-1]|uniref:Uncharacterized protein n=1 Tax=Gaeumannomyces tritici (strain R3-111a-1) TaxID=644352 RepID=J3NTI5_GAET3|nr:hypothetical protein GGTG_04585 [Gaeumannomyces tritici R3-111a-1]EJT79501.1 hypothetical protein GGTG_04585 [Gaeumannomyces tritici R3-111a-1]
MGGVSAELRLINIAWDQCVLRHGNLTESTSTVDNTMGETSLALGAGTKLTGYRLFVFYRKLTLSRNLVFNVAQDKAILSN